MWRAGPPDPFRSRPDGMTKPDAAVRSDESRAAPVPAIDGWFTMDLASPELLGTRCTECGTIFFPRASGFCRNPRCRGREFEEIPLSRRGTVWSYTDARWQPPPPYISADPFEPFAIAAVSLAREKMVVLGQVAAGYGVNDLEIGSEVELVLETLSVVDGVDQLIWRWKPTNPRSSGE